MLVSKQRAPGDRVLMRQFQTSLQMLAPDCVEKTNSQVFYYTKANCPWDSEDSDSVGMC